ncbi:hypothetical protein BFP97_06985 [Roseivirga sp. 4D4]|uniref:LytR/AlgR family response regulator transcription factor n=1 Tax=Roseivirga sp. 4D4 TaxID=1889784 RepID=UPI000853C6AC|nr:LytTR family DNA-binding domain-containing protein [Roseivirga sp. 4D4]OEK01271.1 hypothetical protein BFP97_06985 [Roseivirga sp. 4D4]
MKALIIDDELYVHRSLKKLISHVAKDVEILGTSTGVLEGLNMIKEFNPDLIFLDIQMEDGTGFDLLSKIKGHCPYTIFITAHDEHALEAFNFSAVDYIVKPVETTRLQEAIDKARERHKSGLFQLQLDNLQSHVGQNQRKSRIVLRDLNNVYALDIEEILWLSAEGSYTGFHLTNGETLMISKNLKEYEQMLSGFSFFRIHRSFLVNSDLVTRYDKNENALIFKGGNSLTISISNDQLKSMLG